MRRRGGPVGGARARAGGKKPRRAPGVGASAGGGRGPGGRTAAGRRCRSLCEMEGTAVAVCEVMMPGRETKQRGVYEKRGFGRPREVRAEGRGLA